MKPADDSAVKVLVVDDEEGMRTTLCDVLQAEGYAVHAMGSGKKALEEIRNTGYGIVITDLKLPDMNGVEVMETAKEFNPEIVTIMMTGYASVDTAVQVLNQGAFAYLIKPFNLDEVKAILRKAVHQIWMAQENKHLIDELQLTLKDLSAKKHEMEALTEVLTASQNQLLNTNQQLAQANEDLKHLDQMKSEFLANMSHELRTPLNAVIGFSEAMRDGLAGPVNDKQLHYVDNIFTSGQMLLRLIDDILDLSKIAAGKMDLVEDQFVLDELIGDVQRVIQPLVVKKNLDFKVSSDSPFPSLLFGDQRRLEQVLLNLLSNAIKFTPEHGKIVLRLSSTAQAMRFEVIDTGIGIGKGDQGQLFKQFKQLDSSSRKKYKGTGLGLVISKKLVEIHGGKIGVESVAGKGSNFCFSLPNWSIEDIFTRCMRRFLDRNREGQISQFVLGLRPSLASTEASNDTLKTFLQIRESIFAALARRVDQVIVCDDLLAMVCREIRKEELEDVVAQIEKALPAHLHQRPLEWVSVGIPDECADPKALLATLRLRLQGTSQARRKVA